MRCINLDWLEVFAIEPAPRDPDYFRASGYKVNERSYGTPQYAQMFVVALGALPLLEVRRAPYSIKSEGGIFAAGATHLRLCNNTCYARDPVGSLLKFMQRHGYKLMNTTRLDIALDFQIFDNKCAPRVFLSDYFCGKYAKINQAKFSAHGIDTWESKTYHSVKWGSESSRVTTKMYCKTLELLQSGHDKPYIRGAWSAAGLDPTRDTWRIEFSMKSKCKSLVGVETGALVDLSLHNMRARADLLATFAALYEHYFDFRKVIGDTRKDRCPRVPLMSFDALEEPYKWADMPQTRHAGKRELMMLRYLDEIIAQHWSLDATRAAQSLRSVFVERFRYAKAQP